MWCQVKMFNFNLITYYCSQKLQVQLSKHVINSYVLCTHYKRSAMQFVNVNKQCESNIWLLMSQTICNRHFIYTPSQPNVFVVLCRTNFTLSFCSTASIASLTSKKLSNITILPAMFTSDVNFINHVLLIDGAWSAGAPRATPTATGSTHIYVNRLYGVRKRHNLVHNVKGKGTEVVGGA